ncbi:MAG: helix-turn-helix transcriptional regulator [Gammaproteobacteria bacterium]|nr:helix-turn-helix transcriptional regulator [Gammaproteobacteria bacterium]
MKPKSSILHIALDLINEVYRGISDPRAWDDILKQLIRSTGANKGIISLRSPQNTEIVPSQLPLLAPRIVNIEPSYIGSYLDHYYKIDPWTPFESDMGDTPVLQFSDLLNKKDLHQTTFYQEFLFPQNIEDGFAVMLAKGLDSWVILNLLIDSSPRMPAVDIKALLLILAPHLQRSFTTAIELSLLKSANNELSTLLDRQREGICLLNRKGTILYKNATANLILMAGDELYVKNGRLHSSFTQKERKLYSLIEYASSLRERVKGQLSISRGPGKLPLQIYIVPYFHSPENSIRSQASVIVMLSDPTMNRRIDTQQIKHLFSLTPTEAKLAESLSAGLSLKEYASHQAVSFNTARWHLRNIFDKVGVNSQQELIRHLLTGPLQGESY